MRRRYVAVLALALGGCTGSAGVPAPGFINTDVRNAYIPLAATRYLIFEGEGAGVAIGNGVAVTDAHNDNLLDSRAVIGKSTDYDLMFFHTAKPAIGLPAADPEVGQKVIAYGQGTDGKLRQAAGVVTLLDAPVKAQCAKCAVQYAFTFEGNAGPGFSGGPVLDASGQHLLGIVFGYLDASTHKGSRTIYAYSMRRVLTELQAVENKLPTDVD